MRRHGDSYMHVTKQEASPKCLHTALFQLHTLWKGQNMETVKRAVAAKSWRQAGMNRQGTRICGAEKYPCESITAGTRHYAFVKSYRTRDANNKAYCKLWNRVNNNRSISVYRSQRKYNALIKMLEEKLGGTAEGPCGNCFLHFFSWSQNCCKTIKHIEYIIKKINKIPITSEKRRQCRVLTVEKTPASSVRLPACAHTVGLWPNRDLRSLKSFWFLSFYLLKTLNLHLCHV